MSRGLSAFQCQIMSLLDKRGIVSIFDIHRLKWEPTSDSMALTVRKMLCDNDEAMAFGELPKKGEKPVRSRRQVSALYRAMNSLEHRGVIGAITNVQPRCWVRLDWNKEGEPLLLWAKIRDYAHTKFIYALSSKGWIVRSKGRRFKIGLSPSRKK
jgi:hypothetical protein